MPDCMERCAVIGHDRTAAGGGAAGSNMAAQCPMSRELPQMELVI